MSRATAEPKDPALRRIGRLSTERFETASESGETEASWAPETRNGRVQGLHESM
jgi:hypothetical protein